MYKPHFLIPLSIILILTSCDYQTESLQSDITVASEVKLIVEEPVLDVFGIDKKYEVTTHYIRRNETLSIILGRHGLSPNSIHELSRASADVFNVRRILARQPLHIYSYTEYPGAVEQVAFVVYEINPVDFVRFQIKDSLHVERASKPVHVRERLVSGVITSSLYQTMNEIGVDAQLTHRLADVFAWQVDFHRIQHGDHFQVLFEEKIIEDQVIEIGHVKAAIFTHRNQNYYAFHYKQNGLDEYFDENGNSLRRQFMAAPLDYTRISSRFSNRRYHPVLKRNMPHHGTDYAAPVGTPIRAVGDGIVTAAAYGRNNGNYVRIRHNSVYETGYLHMSRFAQGIRAGTEVKQGQIIGYVGATGLATGPHLCFRFWKHGQPVDPRRIDLPPADPIQSEHQLAFQNRKRELLTRLELDPDNVIQSPAIFAINVGYSGILNNFNNSSNNDDDI